MPKRDMSLFSCRRRRVRMPFAPEIQRYLRHGRWVSKKVGCVGYRWGGWVLVHLFLGRHHHRHRRTEPERKSSDKTSNRRKKTEMPLCTITRTCKEIDLIQSVLQPTGNRSQLDGAAAGGCAAARLACWRAIAVNMGYYLFTLTTSLTS